ncbi:MAG TPA: nitrilase-related carbon-nitrogen hydrolase [Clostridia bacterium]|nr:nitrilase-related carbon-nitrogen hydrolase [Clostridia bacterium]
MLLAVLIASLVKVAVDRKISKPFALAGAACLILWTLPLLFNNLPKGNADVLKASVTAVQGNYAQPEDEIGYEAEMERKLQYYLNIAENLDTDIIVFPETAFGLYDTSHAIDGGYRKSLSDASERLGALSVFCQVEGNSVTKSKEERFFCAALFDEGDILGITRKRNLVPFTESKQYSKGTAYDVYDTRFGKVGISICYDINAGTVERLKANGAQVIVAPFNDRGFGGVYHNIHRYYPVVKAAECSIPIVVANEDGISQIVGSDGRILEELRYGDRGVIRHTVEIRDTPSVYLFAGRYAESALFFILLGWALRSAILRKRAMQTGKGVI